ncbi:MAG: Dna2/Cas4 domain-containing protein [Anaerolineales bacterium]
MITASEIARYLFCARALTYDWRAPRITSFRRQLRLLLAPWQGVLFFLFLIFLGWWGGLDVLFAALVISSVLMVTASASVWLLSRPPQQLPYRDQLAKRNRRVLVAPSFGLVGRPDYILYTDKSAIPILTKQVSVSEGPHQAHTLQVIAYCVLVSETQEVYPPFGIIRYGDGRTFEIDFDEDAVEILSNLMDEIEQLRGESLADINHDERARCYACRYHNRCPQSLF